jgi:hypothetical protein
MKYSESRTSDEDGSRSGSEDETEDEEEEEECQVLLNRLPKRPLQEEKSAQGGTLLTPKVEGVPVTSSKDRFEAICQALGELQGEHWMRGELLWVVCQLRVVTRPDVHGRVRRSHGRPPWRPSAVRRGRPPRPSDGGGRLPRPPKAVRNCHPPEAVRLRRPSRAVRSL